MEFTLLRLATLYFDPAPQREVNWAIQSDDVELNVLGTWMLEGKLRLLVAGVTTLTGCPDVDDENSVIIPIEARTATEATIEAFANLVSIGEMCSRSISSPTPWAALIPEDAEASAWLEGKNGIAQNTSVESRFRFSTESETLQELLKDRLQGVALLSEALSHTHPTGQFHEFVRLFELAFATASTQLVAPLALFLAGNRQGYTEAETKHWLTELRHQATHADLQQQSKFVLASEIRPVLTRVQQAAFDVLFNKTEWHTSTPTRRKLWKPMAFVGAPDSKTLDVQQGSTPTQVSQFIDGFGSYPIDINSGISPIPQNWWCKLPAERKQE